MYSFNLTPLLCAVCDNNIEVVRCLLKCPKIRINFKGVICNPFDFALGKKYFDMAKILLADPRNNE